MCKKSLGLHLGKINKVDYKRKTEVKPKKSPNKVIKLNAAELFYLQNEPVLN